MKNISLLISFIFINVFLAQGQEKTTKHVTLKGTRFAIELPTSDFVAKIIPFVGIEDEKNHSRVIFIELDANKGELGSVSKAQRSLMETGKTLVSETSFDVSGIPATYKKVKGMQKMNTGEGVGQFGEFYIAELAFVYENYHIYAYVSYMTKDEATIGVAIESAIKNMIYNKDKRIDPLDKLNFNIVNESSLKPQLVLPSLLQLSVSGSEDGGDEPFYSINQFEATERNISSLGDGNKLIDNDLSSPRISDKKLQLFENEQFKGYEATAIENEVNGNKRLLYLVVLRGEKHVYRIKGESLYDYEIFLSQFRKLTDSIRE